MKGKGTLVLTILILIFSFSVNLEINSQMDVKAANGYPVHNLNTGLNYTSIQAAINANETMNGHTILVESGTYYENIIVDKALTLIGEDKTTTIIDGNYSGNVVTVEASNVNISRFTLQKSWMGIWPYFNGSGLYLGKGSFGNNISNNVISENGLFGILLNLSSGNIVSDNIFSNNGYGPAVLSSNCNLISNNTISENTSGISISFSDNNTICDNKVFNNIWGIGLGKSGHNRLFGNKMTGNYFNFGLSGSSRSDFNNSVEITNLVDGKPVFFLQNVKDTVLDTQQNIGTLYLIDCENITIKDQSLSNNSAGLFLWETKNSKIENLTVRNNSHGIHIASSTNITVFENSIVDNQVGIWLNSSHFNSISRNKIEASQDRGIEIELSSNNSIRRNNITFSINDGIVISEGRGNCVFENSVIDNGHGILLYSTSNNKFNHNNFVQNRLQMIFIGTADINHWNNSIEGNYWSNYAGVDLDSDGIGDSPHVFDVNNTDHYPLMGMFSTFNTSLGKHVNVISNSTVEDLEYFEPNSTIKMHASNMTGNQTYGFVRICIPHTLMNDPYNITVDGVNPTYWNYTLHDNGTHRWIYFVYEHSTLEIIIVPEFPSLVILPLLMTIMLLGAVVSKRKFR